MAQVTHETEDECTCGEHQNIFPAVAIPTVEPINAPNDEPPLTPTATIALLTKQLQLEQEQVRLVSQQLALEQEKRRELELEVNEQKDVLLLSIDKRAASEIQRLQKRLQKLQQMTSLKCDEQNKQQSKQDQVIQELQDKTTRIVESTKQYLTQVQLSNRKKREEFTQQIKEAQKQNKELVQANEALKAKVQHLETHVAKLEQRYEEKVNELALCKAQNPKTPSSDAGNPTTPAMVQQQSLPPVVVQSFSFWERHGVTMAIAAAACTALFFKLGKS